MSLNATQQANLMLAKESAKALIMKGMSGLQAANQLGLSPARVRQWMTRHGWTSDRSAVQSVASTISREIVVNQSVVERTRTSHRVRRLMSQVVEGQAKTLAESPAQSVAELANSKEGQGLASVAKTVAETASVVLGWGDEGKSEGLIALGDLDNLDAQTAPVIDVETVPPAIDKPAQ